MSDPSWDLNELYAHIHIGQCRAFCENGCSRQFSSVHTVYKFFTFFWITMCIYFYHILLKPLNVFIHFHEEFNQLWSLTAYLTIHTHILHWWQGLPYIVLPVPKIWYWDVVAWDHNPNPNSNPNLHIIRITLPPEPKLFHLPATLLTNTFPYHGHGESIPMVTRWDPVKHWGRGGTNRSHTRHEKE